MPFSSALCNVPINPLLADFPDDTSLTCLQFLVLVGFAFYDHLNGGGIGSNGSSGRKRNKNLRTHNPITATIARADLSHCLCANLIVKMGCFFCF